MSRPLLNPPCKGWKEDLPLPDTSNTTAPGLGYQSPNHQDMIYLEIARPLGGARELMLFFSFPMIIFTATLPLNIIQISELLDSELILISVLLLAGGIWASAFFIRISLSPLATSLFALTVNEKRSMPTTSNTVGGIPSELGRSRQSATTGRKSVPSDGFSAACCQTVSPFSNGGSCCPSSHPERTTSSTGFP